MRGHYFFLVIILGSACSLATNDDYSFGECAVAADCAAGPNGLAECRANVCVLACEAGFGDCDGLLSNGCEAALGTDDLHCGECGLRCTIPGAMASCSAGMCVLEGCLEETADCDGQIDNGCEVSTSSPAHCLGCNQACPDETPICEVRTAANACVENCTEGHTLCGPTCFDLNTNANNCGGCGDRCLLDHAVPECQAGDCAIATCDEGFADCNGEPGDGCEVDIRVDLDHCGACDDVCARDHAAQTCEGGACVLGACDADYENCDLTDENGCETSLATDRDHCRTCETVCMGGRTEWACVASTCEPTACDLGLADCDGSPASCETDLRNDTMNCGGCNSVCEGGHTSWQCVDRGCVLDLCDEFFADCNGSAADGCETDTQTDIGHCGTCDTVCGAGEFCIAGTCEPDITTVAIGLYSGCALRADGRVFCWGTGRFGGTGQGRFFDAQPSATEVEREEGVPFEARDIAVMEYSACAIDESSGRGQVMCWGNDGGLGNLGANLPLDSRRARPIDVIPEAGDTLFSTADMVQVSAQQRVGCARSAAGRVWCWGQNPNGQVWGVVGEQRTALDQGVENIIDVAVGIGSTCVLQMDGTTICWGIERRNRLGTGTNSDTVVQATPVGLPALVELENGGEHTCGLTAAGAVWCWGANANGQVGVSGNVPVPVRVSGFGVADPADKLATFRAGTCVRARSGVWCWGYGRDGAIGDGSTTDFFAPVRIDDAMGNEELADITGLFAGAQGVCATRSNGEVPVCWGSNAEGALPVGEYVRTSSVLATEALLSSVSTGITHSCGTSPLPEGQIYCWGEAATTLAIGHVGIDQPAPGVLAGLDGAHDIAMGLFASCVLSDRDMDGDDEVSCWGFNNYQVLGGPLPASSAAPIEVVIPGDVHQVVMNVYSACALYSLGASDPAVQCWGRNQGGQLGRPVDADGLPPGPLETPLASFGCRPRFLATGGSTTCAVCDSGLARCWGEDGVGQRGDGTATSLPQTSTQVASLLHIEKISSGHTHSCALADEDEDGTKEVYCWGYNYHGEIGSDVVRATAPLEVLGLVAPVDIMVGYRVSCALQADGALFCWGMGGSGMLGDGPQDDSFTPVRVALPAGAPVTALGSSSTEHSLRLYAIRGDGSALVWGINVHGSAGSKVRFLSATPARWTSRE